MNTSSREMKTVKNLLEIKIQGLKLKIHSIDLRQISHLKRKSANLNTGKKITEQLSKVSHTMRHHHQMLSLTCGS